MKRTKIILVGTLIDLAIVVDQETDDEEWEGAGSSQKLLEALMD